MPALISPRDYSDFNNCLRVASFSTPTTTTIMMKSAQNNNSSNLFAKINLVTNNNNNNRTTDLAELGVDANNIIMETLTTSPNDAKTTLKYMENFRGKIPIFFF